MVSPWGQRIENRCSSKSQLAARAVGIAALGSASRAGRRTSRQSASATSRTPSGFAASASPGWIRTVSSTLVESPQSGHGTPVSVRSGQCRPGWPGSSGSVSPATSIPAPTSLSSPGSRATAARPRTVTEPNPEIGLRGSPDSTAEGLGGRELLEEVLAAESGRHADHLRPQGPRELVAELVARLARQLVAAGEEAAHGGELFRGDGGDVPRRRLRPERGRPELAGSSQLADDERARRDVAEPLVLPRHEDADDADEVGARQEVDEPEGVPNRAREEGDRAPVRSHHPQAVEPLPGSATGGEDLEADVVPGEDEKAREEDDGEPEPAPAEAPGQRAEAHDAEEERRLEQQVDERRDEA